MNQKRLGPQNMNGIGAGLLKCNSRVKCYYDKRVRFSGSGGQGPGSTAYSQRSGSSEETLGPGGLRESIWKKMFLPGLESQGRFRIIRGRDRHSLVRAEEF